MRCKKHLSDLSSSAGGVCASCLRHKLLVLTGAQSEENCRNSPPESDVSGGDTPVVCPERKKKMKKNFGISLFRQMFRSKSDLNSNSDYPIDKTTSFSPSGFFNGRREKANRSLSLDEATIGSNQRTHEGNTQVKQTRGVALGNSANEYETFKMLPNESVQDTNRNNRGMSPSSPPSKQTRVALGSTSEYETFKMLPNESVQDMNRNNRGMSPESSSAVSASSPAWKQTPQRRTPGRGRALSITFCLSPLVRASPNRPEFMCPGEIRAPATKSRLKNATSFCKNRSKKLADIGRLNHNR